MSDNTIQVSLAPLSPQHPKAQEIISYLRDQLQLPIFIKQFSIHFSPDSPITVTCDYMPFYKEKKDEH